MLGGYLAGTWPAALMSALLSSSSRAISRLPFADELIRALKPPCVEGSRQRVEETVSGGVTSAGDWGGRMTVIVATPVPYRNTPVY
jgi:hypothetical protein